MKQKFKLGKDALILAIITLLAILTWVGFAVWEAATKTTITKVTREQMLSLNPKIKTEVVDSIKSGLFFSEEELNIVTTPVIEIESEEASQATESSQTATESASESEEE